MCGIYGVLNKFNEHAVKKKMHCIGYRGPDYTGIETIKDNLIFAHNRLAIVDLDSRSNQPFHYQGISIVYNGEVYNYLDLKAALHQEGFQFTTTSDTEVICAAYLKYGTDCVSHFNGMFAFVIFDYSKNILFGARDRLGKKPLFYLYNKAKKSFEFASQLSALTLDNTVSVDWEAVSEYFFWGYNQDPSTPFEEIKKIPAGNSFVLDIGQNELTVKPYWELPRVTQKYTDYSVAKSELKALITDAVKIRMMADVPLGVFLSGGIDSSLIAAVSQSLSAAPIKTYSIGFREDKYDESRYSRQVATYLNTEHHEYYCDYTEAQEFIVNLENYIDEPFADMSAIPTLLLAKKTRQGVTVALSGDGGDELFCGYERYQWINKASKFYHIPQVIRKVLSFAFRNFPHYKVKLLAEGIRHNDIKELYMRMVGLMKPGIVDLNPAKLFGNVSAYWQDNSVSLFENVAAFDVKTYLNNDINTKVDRAAMRFSLETRAPLMDYRITEFSQQIPVDFKIRGNNQKRILKDILYDYLPSEYFDRPKAGFAMPFKEWFRTDLKSFVLDTLTDNNLKNIPIVHAPAVKVLIAEHMAGKANHALELWKLIAWIKFYTKTFQK